MSDRLNNRGRLDSGLRKKSASSPVSTMADGSDAALSLDRLIALEPRLGVLFAEVRAVPTDCRTWGTYESFKRRLTQLVGYRVDDPLLGFHFAYDVALGVLVEELGL